MQLVKSIIPKKIKALQPLLIEKKARFIALFGLLITVSINSFSQDNSPYSRYGIGDLVPPTHVMNRGMGGISAAHNDFLSINFNNPASYSAFQTFRELKSRKILNGRAILDFGLNFESRTLRENSPPRKFTASNAFFSYLQVGVPIRPNWGISFGLRPVSRISYKINRHERLFNPIPPFNPIDSAVTQFEGDGGAYLVSAGTGFKVGDFSFGFNTGYFFGKMDYQTHRALLNDTVDYLQGNYQSRTTYGNVYLSLGAQYKFKLNNKVSMTLGAYGNLEQRLNATRDTLSETFFFDPSAGNTRLDSVSEVRNLKGKIVYPASFTVGFVVEKPYEGKESSWLFGADFTMQQWDNYRFYGKRDSVQNSWQLKIGGQVHPTPRENYWSNVTYRAGFSVGPDYVRVGNKLPQLGASFGLGLPLRNYNRLSPGQATIINLAFEYGKRGNNTNLLRENTFRFSVGFSLSDLWFIKRKYE